MAREQLDRLFDGRLLDAESFVQRTLTDFGLSDAFADCSPWERIHCLQWIASSGNLSTAEERVSQLLDALDAEEPLYRLYRSA